MQNSDTNSRKIVLVLAPVAAFFVILNLNNPSWTVLRIVPIRVIQDVPLNMNNFPPIKPNNRWIVVTSINYPTEDVKRLASTGWNLVVVADKKTPVDWSLQGVHFLGIREQASLGFSLTKLLPYGTYTRKNVGYLYAIMRGAEWIYDTDDDNKPYGELLHADRKTGLNEKFDANAPPLTLEAGTYAPWNSQNTLFNRKAFFTMFLPSTVEFRVTDIWRSYFAQKLLHLIGETIAFYPVNAIQIRNAHNYLADFEDERAVYLKSGQIIEFLSSWNCTQATIGDCTIELAEQFRDRQFWEKEDVDLMQAWISDLKKFGYEFPPLALPTDYQASDAKDSHCHQAHLDFSQSGKKKEIASRVQNFEDIMTFCNEYGQTNISALSLTSAIQLKQMVNTGLVQKSKTALIITANWPWQHGIGVLQRLYEPYFAVTVFCGTWNRTNYGVNETLPLVIPGFNYIHLSQQQIHQGYFEYYCLAKARDLKLQNIEGYYLVADDSIFNPWVHNRQNISNFSDGHRPDLSPSWWNGPNGKAAANATLDLFTKKYAKDPKVQKVWAEFNARVKANGHNKTGAEVLTEFNGRSASDFMYVPTSDIDFVANMFEIFSEGKLFLETSTAKIIHALNFTKPPQFKYLWGDERNIYEKFYNSSILFMHPIKLGPVETNRNETKNTTALGPATLSTMNHRIEVPEAVAYCEAADAVGTCQNNQCVGNNACVSGNICCPLAKFLICTKSNSSGQCTLGKCPGTMQCVNGNCCQ